MIYTFSDKVIGIDVPTLKLGGIIIPFESC
jgi:hypothetical protein